LAAMCTGRNGPSEGEENVIKCRRLNSEFVDGDGEGPPEALRFRGRSVRPIMACADR
jgi:hypothetical protein